MAVPAMKVIPVQEALQRKFQRQSETIGLELHADGLCAHVGKISPGCYWCFSPMDFSWGVQLGTDVGLPNICNLTCSYCFGRTHQASGLKLKNSLPVTWRLPGHYREIILSRLQTAQNHLMNHDIPSVAFTGDGAEPLLYLPVIREYMNFFRTEVEPLTKTRPWYKIYTNGLLATKDILLELKDLGIDEIRFHLGATNFSRGVIRKLATAVTYLPTISVETPAWPPHRQNLLTVLPLLEDMGVKHLNLIEVGVTGFNYKSIAAVFPEAEIYHSGMGLFLDDGGLVYEIIQEVCRRGYAFSVLDCHSLVKKLRDERIFAQYCRDALRLIKFGEDWEKFGVQVERN